MHDEFVVRDMGRSCDGGVVSLEGIRLGGGAASFRLGSTPIAPSDELGDGGGLLDG